VRIEYSLSLPRDAATVSIVRRLAKSAMLELGVVTEDIRDVALMLSEACANVIEHASVEQDDYRVLVALSEDACEIRVIDTGRGFDADHLSDVALRDDSNAERGRGIRIMQALADRVTFESEAEHGTVVYLRKRLTLEDDSLFRQIAERST